MPHVVIARPVVASQVARQGRKNPSSRELQKSSIRDSVHAAAPGVVDLPLQAMSQSLRGGYLKAVIVAVLAGGKLCHRAESWIGRLRVGKWCKTALAHGLISVHLRQIGLVDCARPNVLCLHSSRCSKLMFQSQTPFHEIRGMEFAIRDGRNRDGWKTAFRICQGRCAGELAIWKP